MTFTRPILAASFAAMLSLGLGSAVLAQEASNADTVVASINGETVTLADLVILRATLDQRSTAGATEEQLYDNLLTQATNKILLRQAAERAKMDERKMVTRWIEFQRAGILADVYAQERVSEQVTQELIESEYQKRFVEAERANEYNANHILVQDEEEAKALAVRAKAGEDFEQLAKDNSKGPSAPTGGKLGWFKEGDMVPIFYAAAARLEAGGISDPVKSQFGWHVIKVNDVRPLQPPALEQVQGEIQRLLSAQVTEAVVNALRQAGQISTIEGRPGLDRLGDITLITEEE
ncbi:MAG: foldase protein PrsA [Pikeienuella sp.]